jgi:hypothetical protein
MRDRYPGYPDRMIKTGEEPHYEIEEQKKAKSCGKGHKKNSDRDTDQTEKEDMPVLEAIGFINNNDLRYKCNKQPKI